MQRKLTVAALTAATLLSHIDLGYAKQAAGKPFDDPSRPKIWAIAQSSDELAVSLYKKLRVEKGNLFFSPYSISSALSMVYAGASGNTKVQMADTLHYWLGDTQHHISFQALNTKLEKDAAANKYSLRIANHLWGDQSMKGDLNPDYLELNKKFYGAELEPLDFHGDAEGAAKKINQWTSDKTNEKIKEIVSASLLKEKDTALVLTNAIYFKGDWAQKFDKASTKSETFYSSLKETSSVDMMTMTSKFRYLESKDAQVISLPYQGNKLDMLVILPTKKNGLATLEKSLTTTKINDWINALVESDVQLKLPKFKLETSFELSKQLKALGMKDAFTAKADFSGIAQSKLQISKVLHKGFVEVNEEGSEAAAATAVVMTKEVAYVPKPKDFTADHPFLFMIRDSETNAILFMGRIVTP